MMDAMFLKQFRFLGCDLVQVWQENGDRQPGVDLFLGEDLVVDGDALYINEIQVGRRVDASNASGQGKARAMAGSVEWILLELGEWKMIPIENIIAACDGGPTKVAVRISSPEQVIGAAFALQMGVDAILVPDVVTSSCELPVIIGSKINATVAYLRTDATGISELVI